MLVLTVGQKKTTTTTTTTTITVTVMTKTQIISYFTVSYLKEGTLISEQCAGDVLGPKKEVR